MRSPTCPFTSLLLVSCWEEPSPACARPAGAGRAASQSIGGTCFTLVASSFAYRKPHLRHIQPRIRSFRHRARRGRHGLAAEPPLRRGRLACRADRAARSGSPRERRSGGWRRDCWTGPERIDSQRAGSRASRKPPPKRSCASTPTARSQSGARARRRCTGIRATRSSVVRSPTSSPSPSRSRAESDSPTRSWSSGGVTAASSPPRSRPFRARRACRRGDRRRPRRRRAAADHGPASQRRGDVPLAHGAPARRHVRPVVRRRAGNDVRQSADRPARRLHGRRVAGGSRPLPPRSFTRTTEIEVAAARDAADAAKPVRLNYRMVSRDGRVVWVQDEAVAVLDESGRPLCIQGYLLDVSERRSRRGGAEVSSEQQRRRPLQRRVIAS